MRLIPFLSLLLFGCAKRTYHIPEVVRQGIEVALKGKEGAMTANGFLYVLETMPDDSLKPLKNEPLYTHSIERLLEGNFEQRMVAYGLLTKVQDTSYNSLLLQRMDTARKFEDAYNLPLAVMTLCPTQTDLVYAFILKNETFGDVIWTPQFLKSMDKESILRTAYMHISDTLEISRILVLSILAARDESKQSDSLLISALENSPYEKKGYIIAAFQFGKERELRPILGRYINDSLLSAISKEAIYINGKDSEREFLKRTLSADEIRSLDFKRQMMQARGLK